MEYFFTQKGYFLSRELTDTVFFKRRASYVDDHRELRQDIKKRLEEIRKCNRSKDDLGGSLTTTIMVAVLASCIAISSISNVRNDPLLYYFSIFMIAAVWIVVCLKIDRFKNRHTNRYKTKETKYCITFNKEIAEILSSKINFVNSEIAVNVAEFFFNQRVFRSDSGYYLVLGQNRYKKLSIGDRVGTGNYDLIDFFSAER